MSIGGHEVYNLQPWLEFVENKPLLLKAQIEFLFESGLALPVCCTSIVCGYAVEYLPKVPVLFCVFSFDSVSSHIVREHFII
jgi:integral membrane sensor domain MASE1